MGAAGLAKCGLPASLLRAKRRNPWTIVMDRRLGLKKGLRFLPMTNGEEI
jgi:hypothetical protein